MAKSLLNKNGKAKDRAKGDKGAIRSARRTKRKDRREARKAEFEDMFGNIGMDTGYDDATDPETGVDPYMADYGYEDQFGGMNSWNGGMGDGGYSTVAGTNAPVGTGPDPYSTSIGAGSQAPPPSLLGNPAAPVAPVAPTAPGPVIEPGVTNPALAEAQGAGFALDPNSGLPAGVQLSRFLDQMRGTVPMTREQAMAQPQAPSTWQPASGPSQQAIQSAMANLPPMGQDDIRAKVQQMQQAQAALGPGAPSPYSNPEYHALKQQMISNQNGPNTLEQRQLSQARNALVKPRFEAHAALKGERDSLFPGSQPSLLGNTSQPGTGGTMQANYGMQQPSQPSLLGGGSQYGVNKDYTNKSAYASPSGGTAYSQPTGGQMQANYGMRQPRNRGF